jgi:VWFA-related protein
MNPAKLIRIVLLLSLALSLVAAVPNNWPALFSPHPVLAQDKTKSQQRRPKIQKTSPQEPNDQEVIKGQSAISVSVDLVSLQVLVTDTKGNVLTGLKPENFTIYEDNVKQEISNFSPVESGITAVLLVEFSRNIENFVYDIWNAMDIFANSLRKEDWVAVIGYDMRSTILCDFTQDRKELDQALRRFTIPASDDSNLSDAIINVLDRTEEIEGKVAIVLLSTGLDTFSRHTYEDALNKCKEANASVYAISLGQYFRLRMEARGYTPSIDLLMADNRLKSFAEFTGGAAYFPRFQTELPAIFSDISQLLRSQYSIAYASTNTNKDGKFRKIRVDVEAKLTDAKGKPIKLKVTHRKGYLAKEL